VPEFFPPDDGPEIPATEMCPKCVRDGHVTVSPFVWNSVSRLLFWHCRFCDHTWITDERRDKDRR